MTAVYVVDIGVIDLSPTEFEVVLQSHSGLRRLALCTHKDDAQDIANALKFARQHGIVQDS